MGASEGRNDRGSPGDEVPQKARAVEVVHGKRFDDLDLVVGAVKMRPVTWRQDCVRKKIMWTRLVGMGTGQRVLIARHPVVCTPLWNCNRDSAASAGWGRAKEWAAGGRGCGVGGGGAGSMPGYGRKEAAPPAPRAVMAARPTSREAEPGRRALLHGKQPRFGPVSR